MNQIQQVQVVYATDKGYNNLNDKPSTEAKQTAIVAAVTNLQAEYSPVSGTLVSTQSLYCPISKAGLVIFTLHASALAGHNCAFIASINSTNGIDGDWFAIAAKRTNATSSTTYEATTGILAAQPGYAWTAICNGYTFVKVTCSAHTSGTANWKIKPAMC